MAVECLTFLYILSNMNPRCRSYSFGYVENASSLLLCTITAFDPICHYQTHRQ